MIKQNENANDKTIKFGKAWYISLFALGVVAFMITIIALSANNKSKGVVPTSASKMSFYLPIAEATIAKDYNDKALQYNATLNQWEVHKGIDFSAPLGAEVCAVSAGVVTDIYSNYLDGTVVVIEHANNLKSKYSSLDSSVKVKVGDTVVGGQTIGTVANTAKGEAGDKAHLHFEMLENDKKIDPNGYLNLASK